MYEVFISFLMSGFIDIEVEIITITKISLLDSH